MTYLELVNAVLTKLREDTVDSVAESTYATLVGAFVNDAKRVVEDAWVWRAIRRTVDISVTAGSSATFDLEDYNTNEGVAEQFNERARIFLDPQTSLPNICVTTSGKERELGFYPPTTDYLNNISNSNSSTRGSVYGIFFTTNPGAAASRSNIRIGLLPWIPVDTETVRIMLINPQNDLTTDGQILQIPSNPVVQLAYVYCLYERGEEMGEQFGFSTTKATLALSDAISLDSQDTSEAIVQVY